MMRKKIISNPFEIKIRNTKRLANDWALGLLPLLSISWTLVLYVKEGRLDEILWICNVSNYLLGISLLLAWAPGIWAATLWIVIGTPLWLYDCVNTSQIEVHSFFTHLGSSAIGLFACRNHPVKNKYWLKTFLLLIPFQLLARILTRPVYNVNGAFRTYESQMSYVGYWLFCALAFNLSLFVTEWLIRRVLLQSPLRKGI
jgi:hypothetical protein